MSYLPVDAIVSELCTIALTAKVLIATLGTPYCGRPLGKDDCARLQTLAIYEGGR
jgi:hypothetical protein